MRDAKQYQIITPRGVILVRSATRAELEDDLMRAYDVIAHLEEKIAPIMTLMSDFIEGRHAAVDRVLDAKDAKDDNDAPEAVSTPEPDSKYSFINQIAGSLCWLERKELWSSVNIFYNTDMQRHYRNRVRKHLELLDVAVPPINRQARTILREQVIAALSMNVNRQRNYGLRIGDVVTYRGMLGDDITGLTIISFDVFDNNECVGVNANGERFDIVCEHCDITLPVDEFPA